LSGFSKIKKHGSNFYWKGNSLGSIPKQKQPLRLLN